MELSDKKFWILEMSWVAVNISFSYTFENWKFRLFSQLPIFKDCTWTMESNRSGMDSLSLISSVTLAVGLTLSEYQLLHLLNGDNSIYISGLWEFSDVIHINHGLVVCDQEMLIPLFFLCSSPSKEHSDIDQVVNYTLFWCSIGLGSLPFERRVSINCVLSSLNISRSFWLGTLHGCTFRKGALDWERTRVLACLHLSDCDLW